MSYKKTVWEDFVTPLDENNMNNIENGIEHVDQELHKTQADLQETKNHLAQTDVNVATNKQSIIDLEAKHDEDIQNLDDKFTNEINDTNAEVATKLPKQDIDILKDVNIEVSGDQAFITKTTVNLNNDTLEPVEQTATQIIPDATEQQSGLMTKATVKAINQMQEQIEQLQGKTTRLLYTDKTDPTAAEINAFVIAEGYTEPFDGIAVVVDETYHIWHFYEGGVGWKDDGLDTVTTFTNDIAGIIKGSNDDGKVYANEDGTGSVKGWDTVKQDIASNAQAITQRATLTQLAATNQNLTNLTNHVDDVEEQLQQNITNGDNALDAKITNLNNKTLQLPTTTPTKQSIVTITTENAQQNLTSDNFVMTTAQTLTAAQKLQARVNLDLPATLFDGSYTSLGNKPVLNTDNSTALATNAAEEINGIMNLHKISKTGTSTDLVDSADLARQTQVVRTDTSQSLTDAEKQQAQINITHTAKQDHVASGAQVGWYQVANLKTNGNYNIKIKQAFNYNVPDAMQLAISINHRLFTGEPFASITQLSGVKPATFSLSKIRVRQGTDSDTTFLDVYNPDSLWNTTWVDITSDTRDVVVEPNTPFQFIGTEDNPSGYKISSLDLVTGFNTNSLSVNNEEWQKTDFLTLNSGIGPINAVTDRGRNYFRNSMVETSGVVISTSGWYRVAKLTDYMSGTVDICKQFNYELSQVVSIDFGLAYRLDAGTSYLKVTSTPKFAANQCIDQVRIAQYTSDSTSYPYLEVHINTVSGQNNGYWSIFKDISAALGTELTADFQMLAFEPASGTPIVTKVIDVKGDVNVSNLNVDNTVTISGRVSDLNTISQPVNSTVTYTFSGGCANAPTTDSGMVIQMQESTSYRTQLAIMNDQNGSTWRRSYRDGSWQEWKQILNTKKDDILIYDMDSEDENINRGFTSGMKGTDYIQLDFSQFKKIRIYARLYNANAVQEFFVKNRKLPDMTLTGVSPTPTVLSFLKVQMNLEPYLDRFQVMAYAKYVFSRDSGTFTLDFGMKSDSFLVYRIEGIV